MAATVAVVTVPATMRRRRGAGGRRGDGRRGRCGRGRRAGRGGPLLARTVPAVLVPLAVAPGLRAGRGGLLGPRRGRGRRGRCAGMRVLRAGALATLPRRLGVPRSGGLRPAPRRRRGRLRGGRLSRRRGGGRSSDRSGGGGRGGRRGDGRLRRGALRHRVVLHALRAHTVRGAAMPRRARPVRRDEARRGVRHWHCRGRRGSVGGGRPIRHSVRQPYGPRDRLAPRGLPAEPEQRAAHGACRECCSNHAERHDDRGAQPACMPPGHVSLHRREPAPT